jgi:hypothetical protein
LCLFLPSSFPLQLLFLAKATGATYRIGVGCEAEFPFLNISLRPDALGAYGLRSFLCKQFAIPEATAVLDARHAGKPISAHEAKPLASSSMLLLSLDPPVEGEPWSADELRMVSQGLMGKHRLLALASDPKTLSRYQNLLETLEIRTAPISAVSGTLLEALWQYGGIVSLNAPNVHLFLNFSQARVFLVSETPESELPLPADSKLHVFDRKADVRTWIQEI